MNATLGSEVNKLQKQLDQVRSKQDGGQLTSLQDELEMLREQLQEASAQKKQLEKEHSSEKMKLEKVRTTVLCIQLDTQTGYKIPEISEVIFCVFLMKKLDLILIYISVSRGYVIFAVLLSEGGGTGERKRSAEE